MKTEVKQSKAFEGQGVIVAAVEDQLDSLAGLPLGRRSRRTGGRYMRLSQLGNNKVA